MRFSLRSAACTSAVLSVLLVMPCLAQPASGMPQPASGAHGPAIVNTRSMTFRLHCKDVSHLSRCIAGQKSLNKQEKEKLKALIPKMRLELKKSTTAKDEQSGACFLLKVYKVPRGYPEKHAGARPQVTVCSPAAKARVRALVQPMKRHRH